MACLGLNFQGVARLLKINDNMHFYKKKYGYYAQFFFLFKFYGGGKGGDEVHSVSSEH